MKITPAEIRKQEFRRSLAGYSIDDVRSYLDVMAQAVDELRMENDSLKTSVAGLETKLSEFRSMEQALHTTILQAQETGGRTMEHARKESMLIIQEAELRASVITEKARNEVISLREQITLLGSKRDAVVSKLKLLLHSELDVLKALEAEDRLHDRDQLTLGLSKEKQEIEDIVKSLG